MTVTADSAGRFAEAVQRGDLTAVLSAIDKATARAEDTNDDSEVRAFLRVAATVPFGRQ